MTLAQEIVRDAQSLPGKTYDVAGRELPQWGYFVGGSSDPLILWDDDTAMVHKVTRWLSDLDHPEYVGFWHEEGRVYFDHCEWYSDTGHAFQVAEERQELAVWNIGTGSVEYLYGQPDGEPHRTLTAAEVDAVEQARDNHLGPYVAHSAHQNYGGQLAR